MVFIIVVSILFVGALVLFAFFPIKVSWFFYMSKPKLRHAQPIREKPSSRKNYTMIDEDSYDDPEL
jgi:hypothetical protein